MIVRSGAILLILIFLSVPTWAQEEIRATYFPIQIITEKCEISQSGQEQIKDGIYFLYNFFRDKFGLEYDKPIEIKIHFFSNFKDFKAYQKKFSDSTSDTGFHAKKTTNEIVILYNKDELAVVQMTYHEATHFFVYYHFYRLPMWVEEGIAEYFRSARIEGDNCVVSYDLKEEAWLKYWLSNGMLIDLKVYVDMPYEDWLKYNKKLYNAGYMTSRCLIYFFMSSEGRQTILKDVLYYFAQHHITEKTSPVFNTYYPGGVEQLEKDWLDWLMQSKRDHVHSLKRQ